MFVNVAQIFSQGTQAYNELVAKSFDRFYNNPFPSIELEKADSNLFNTSALAGKTVYVDFWFTTCAPCIMEIPSSQALQQFFAADTNIVFLSICVENKERKQAWKNLVRERNMKGIHLFYARNQPQQINLLRQMGVDTYPTYLLVNNLKIIGYNAPSPSQKGFVQWAIYQASKNIGLSQSYTSIAKHSKASNDYLAQHWANIAAEPIQ